VPDYRDLDSDNDSIPDAVEVGNDSASPIDSDGDGISNFQDTDSDNDGLSDAEEVGGTPDQPMDSDGNGIPDFMQAFEVVVPETDSDGDGISDAIESNDAGSRCKRHRR